MTNKGVIVFQDIFLNQVRRDHIPVTIHLVNGFQIRGFIKGFDNYVIIVESEGKQMMLYKQAISTITPSRPVPLSSDNNEENQ
ncbi:MAG: RNA chaperone Hfq [Caldicoprobacterales bacterium]|jgi:host factor-I protein|nr:RNA chaperone Hfq [Clostridiales bacterium]